MIDRAVLSTILHLDNEEGCYATNEWLAEVCGCARKTITRSVKTLTDYGMITTTKNGKRRVICVLGNNSAPVSDHGQNVPHDDGQNVPQSGTKSPSMMDKLSHDDGQIVPHNSIDSNIGKKTVTEEGHAPLLLERVRSYRLEKIRRGERVPDSLTAEKFFDHYEQYGWKTNTGRSLLKGDAWKKKFDDWCKNERQYPSQAAPKDEPHGSFDTGAALMAGLVKSYGEDAAGVLAQYNRENGVHGMTDAERDERKRDILNQLKEKGKGKE